MLNKITFAFALLLAANVEAISLHSAGKSTGKIRDDEPSKDGMVVMLGNSQYDETKAVAVVGEPELYDTAGNPISNGESTVASGGETQEDAGGDTEE